MFQSNTSNMKRGVIMSEYKVRLDIFEGPLDLLLYLIKELEIDIYDIPMKVLSEQYMQYIHAMKALEINVASEYLLMASELLKIKSKMLLPEPAILEADEDPRELLVEQLLEYQNYKIYAEELETLMHHQHKIITKVPQQMQEIDMTHTPLQVDLLDLVEAFNKVQARIQMAEETRYVIAREHMSHEAATSYLNTQFKQSKQLTLDVLLSELSGRHQIVSVFVVVLEEIKNRMITMKRNTAEIVLERSS